MQKQLEGFGGSTGDKIKQKSTQQVAGGEILPLSSEGSVKQLPWGDEECHGRSSPGPVWSHPRRSVHGTVGLLPFSCLAFFPQLILWHLMPRDVEHSCQDCTLPWREGKEAGGCSAARPSHRHPRSHLEPSETHSKEPPTMGIRGAMCAGTSLGGTLEMEGSRHFLTLLFSNCREFASGKCLIWKGHRCCITFPASVSVGL